MPSPLPAAAAAAAEIVTGMAVQAPPVAVSRALRRAELYSRTARVLGRRLEVAGELVDVRRELRVGDLLRVRPDGGPALLRPVAMHLRVRATDPTPVLEIVHGPLTGATVSFRVDGDPAGAVVRCTVGRPGRMPARRIRAGAGVLLGIATLLAREPLVVVAGVVVDADRVLAARRAAPSAHAGGWEFPGGKVEPGEEEDAALVRELREELGITVRVGERVGPDVDLGGSAVLRCRVATVRSGTPTPQAGDHDRIRWLKGEELTEVDWLPADLAVLPDVRALLAATATAAENRAERAHDDRPDNAG